MLLVACGSALLGPSGAPPPAPSSASAATLPSGFTETTAFSGLTNPTVVRFAADGRVFVAEKGGLIKVFDSLTDTTPTTFADLRTNVHNFWDRGLLGMTLAPNFPASPYVYVLYAYDHQLGGSGPPLWGDGCPTPPGPTTDGCVVSGRLSRLQANGNVMTGAEQVLVEDWCQQYPSHSVGTVEFGPEGALYASGGDGASFNFVDYGQDGSPLNPCGDPPGGVGATLTPPTAEGGALRSQDLRTSGDPVSLDGSLIRVDPATGAGLPSNPLASSSDPNARRIIAHGLRNPFRFTFRPGTSELWVGDVGWNDWEEINRILDPADGTVENFGWPCYEGNPRQSGYDAANLNVCENLYGNPSADTKPYFAYNHANKVVPAEGCPTGSSSIAGMSFEFSPSGSVFPADYQGALFFADYSRDCIWVMKKDGNPIPSPGHIETFAAGAANPVNLEFGRDGALYYADFDGGTIRRIAPGGAPPPSCPNEQFRAEYFANMTLAGSPVLTQCETTLDHDWALGGPGGTVPNDTFSARWTGQFTFPSGDTTFSVTGDDGVRLWLDGQLLIDAWIDQSATTYRTSRTLTAGTHAVTVEYYENTGDAVAKASWTSVPSACPAGVFRAQYFSNMTLAGTPVLTQCEAPLDHDWALGGPGAPVPNDTFSARWTGQFTFPAGDTTFSVTGDDGIRLWVDGQLLIDKWIDQSATTYTANRTLGAGTHEVSVEYYENTGDAVAKASWSGAGGDTTPPTVTAQSPAPGATGVAVGVSPTATFSEAMNAGTLTMSTFTLVKQGTTTPVAATVSYTGQVATLDPSVSLEAGATYTASVKGGPSGVADVAGNRLASDVDWTFTTAASGNQPPVPVIDSPGTSLTWKVGDPIAFTGHASDPEQGALPASALSWTLLMQHCPSNCHSHTLQSWSGVASGSFAAPDHEYPSYLELRLTATDGAGSSATTTLRLDPRTVVLSFASSPSGLQVSVNASSSTTLFTRTVIVGSTNSVSAVSPQNLGGTTYTFSSWSDGGAQTHNLVAPAIATTYTAAYAASPTAPVNTSLPTTGGGPARVGRPLTATDGTWTGTLPITFTYQWLRCSSTSLTSCATIATGTSKTYLVTAADLGARLRVRVTATNTAGSASAVSGATSPVKR